MPFFGTSDAQTSQILSGSYTMKRERWDHISAEGEDFIKSLMTVDPNKRLTAQQALEHPWISQGDRYLSEEGPDAPGNLPKVILACEALRSFSHASKFRRCCLEILAWSLSNEDREKVRESFLSLDENHQGTITLQELKHAMVDKLHLVDESEVLQVFEALDYNNDHEIHYSDFLAAMAVSQIDVDDGVLRDTFRRMDTDSSGYITVENLRSVLGSKVEGEKVEAFIAEADQIKDGRLSFAEFSAYLRGTRLDNIGALRATALLEDANNLPADSSEKRTKSKSPTSSKAKMSSAVQGFRGFFGMGYPKAAQPKPAPPPAQAATSAPAASPTKLSI